MSMTSQFHLHRRPLLVALAIALLLALHPAAYAQQPDSPLEPANLSIAGVPSAAEDRLLIGVEPGASQQDVAVALAGEGLTLGRYWPQFGVAEALLSVTASAASDFSAPRRDAMAAQSELIRYVALDDRVYAASMTRAVLPAAAPGAPQLEPVPNDPLFSQQWALARIDAVKAWDISHGDPDVVVAIIDSGYDAGHPDLAPAQVWTNEAEANGQPGIDDDDNGYVDDVQGWDWIFDDNMPEDGFGHGTHVLGTVAATTGNALGIAGAGRNLMAAPLRMLDAYGFGNITDLVDAIAYAVNMDMSIVNLSLTTTGDNPAMRDAVQAASAAGLIIVAAAGNTAMTSNPGPAVLWPGAYPETVAVAATDSQDLRANFSNYGPEITVAAPGVGVVSLYPTGAYASLSGTSMATPHVSALLGLLRSLRPDLAATDLLDLMTSTADDVNASAYPGVDNYLGAGRIDMDAALLAASAGLALRTVPSSLDPVDTSQPLALRVQVAASGLPVEGAVVYLQILATDDVSAVAPLSTLRRVSNNAGNVEFSFTAPDQPGVYTLRAQVGSAVLDASIRVADPLNIRIAIEKPELVVGGETTPFTVTVRGPDSKLVVEPLDMHLETSRGRVNGQPTLDTVVSGGVFTGTLRSGNVAGTATLSTTIRLATGAANAVFLPGPPSILSFNEPPDKIVADATTTAFTLSVRVEDAYGNPVADGIGIRFSSSAGTIEPLLDVTSGGSAKALLTIPRTLSAPVYVEAEVAGYNLFARKQVTWITMLPFVLVE